MFCVLGFFNFNFALAPFLLSNFLGAGLGNLTQKLLGAHQKRFDDHSEREHGCLRFTDQITFPVLHI
jgi:hypothetical protein